MRIEVSGRKSGKGEGGGGREEENIP